MKWEIYSLIKLFSSSFDFNMFSMKIHEISSKNMSKSIEDAGYFKRKFQNKKLNRVMTNQSLYNIKE